MTILWLKNAGLLFILKTNIYEDSWKILIEVDKAGGLGIKEVDRNAGQTTKPLCKVCLMYILVLGMFMLFYLKNVDILCKYVGLLLNAFLHNNVKKFQTSCRRIGYF